MQKVDDQFVAIREHESNYRSYTLGYILSVVWTFLAYFVVTRSSFTTTTIIAIIVVLASLQLVTQLVFFLHLGRGSKSRWNLMAFLFMSMVLIIIVAGSLWIMQNLNYNMQMTPEQMNDYMHTQVDKGF